jgi:DNA primase
MPGYIPDDIVQRIKSESDIVSVISEFVSLKKSGKDYKGLCPFHQEKTPSFYVISSKGFYHCFGCGAGGNIINFIMEHERLEYPDALRFLAAKAGIAIPETTGRKSDSENLFEALSLAAIYFSKSLRDPALGKTASDYLESRGISAASIETFGLGYAPSGWDGLLKLAAPKGIQPAILEKVGLVIKKEGYYDRFRNRLMVPVRGISGRVLGFGGRVLPGDDGPKYINSPETDIYRKGRLLFGLDVSKEEIRQRNEAIVVEGYFDLIALHQYGIRNVVAVSGTGFTSEQAALLARFCNRVILLYDPDSAGLKAAFRACGVLYNSAVEPRIVTLQRGYDPDTFVREKGVGPLKNGLGSGADVVDFVCNAIKGKFSDQALSIQKRIAEALSEAVAPIQDNLTRDLLLKKIFANLDLDLETLRGIGKVASPTRSQVGRDIPPGRRKPENEFLSLLLNFPELIGKCAGSVDGSMFVDEASARIFELIWKTQEDGRPINIPDLFDEIVDDSAKQRLSEIAIVDLETADAGELFENHLKKFEQISLKRRTNELKKMISEAEAQADRVKIDELTREFQKLQIRGGNE